MTHILLLYYELKVSHCSNYYLMEQMHDLILFSC